MIAIAKEFLTRCFDPGSRIALLLRAENPAKTQQRIVTLDQAIASRYLGWLAHENRGGANVYVAANPLLPGSRKRTKEHIESVRHLYLDIDEDGEARLAALRTSVEVPSPSAVLSTSSGKYQILWRVERFTFEEQETMLKRLAIAFCGDPACTDCNRVLRIPGFLNRKYTPAPAVTVEYCSDKISLPSDFQLVHSDPIAGVPLRGPARSNGVHKDSRSEADWAWTCTQLALGTDADELTTDLASRRSDKPNPLYYAQRTVDVASARQWFLEAASIDDVIAMLVERRRTEFPAAFCFARAQEIAATARRMVASRRLA